MSVQLKSAAALVLVLALLLPLCGCRRETPSAQSSIFAMDTVMDLTVYGESAETCSRVLGEAVEEVNRLDALLDVTDERSELHALNAAAGAPVTLPEETASLLRETLDLCALTEGNLDITARPAVSAWGFAGGEYRVPPQEELDALADRIDYRAVQLDGTACTLPEGMELDLGSAAKGYAADRLADLLAEEGITSAMMDLGQSTLYAPGQRPDGGAWRIGIQDPAGEDYLAVVELEGHMSTSGGYQRFFEEDGVTYWHIMDPDTASPARSGLASVTVTGPSGLLCDCLSTALFVMGLEEGTRFWRSHPELGIELLFIEDSGAISITPGMEEHFSLVDQYRDREVTVLS